MNTLNNDEIKIIVKYIDHETMKDLATALLDTNDIKQAICVLNCAIDNLIQERVEIAISLNSIASHLSDIEELAGQVYDNHNRYEGDAHGEGDDESGNSEV